MTNLTITVDAETLRRARIRALEQDTSVNVVLREHLERYAETSSAGIDVFLGIARRSRASSGGHGRAWTRDSAHER